MKKIMVVLLIGLASVNAQASGLWDDIKKDAEKAWEDTKTNASKVEEDGKEAYEEKDQYESLEDETKKQGWKPVKPKEDEAGIPVE